MTALNVVSLIPLPAGAREQITAVDPNVHLHLAAGWFNDEVRETWGDHVADSYLVPARDDIPPKDERNAVLAEADVVLGGFPLLVDLVARAPRLRWVHQTPAGASNLHRCDLWDSDIPVSGAAMRNAPMSMIEMRFGIVIVNRSIMAAKIMRVGNTSKSAYATITTFLRP